jgi:fumarate reductase flavoprotein subunit
MQREWYITYSRDEAFKKIIEYSHWLANARLVRTIVDESARIIPWLQKAGVMLSSGLC